MSNSNESVELTLPINAAYISAARLTASSIANRLGFGIEEIEDIKTAVSEACTFIIERLSGQSQSPFKLMFKPEKNCVNIVFDVNNYVDTELIDQETSILMIKALMDKMTFENGKNNFVIKITKNHATNPF